MLKFFLIKDWYRQVEFKLQSMVHVYSNFHWEQKQKKTLKDYLKQMKYQIEFSQVRFKRSGFVKLA